MFLEIITPDKKLFSGEAKSIKLPGTDGSFGILDDHAAMIASLKKGTVKVVNEKNATENFNINGGVVEVLKNKVILLAE
ncbi:MAG: ATP synthase F1 subunit epsilon [Bacteroidetes bacterium]|nr:ATP synthase F1 subunit epsilon [Bacteroidota bacterium]